MTSARHLGLRSAIRVYKQDNEVLTLRSICWILALSFVSEKIFNGYFCLVISFSLVMCCCSFVFLISNLMKEEMWAKQGDQSQMMSFGLLLIGWSRVLGGQFGELDSVHGPVYFGHRQLHSEARNHNSIFCQMFCTCGPWSGVCGGGCSRE